MKLSRLFILAIFCLLLSIRASAIPISISSYTLPNWQYAGTTATLKLFANQDFLTSDGVLIRAGNAGNGTGFFQVVNCTVSATSLSIASITNFPTTTDSLTAPSATLTARFYDYRGIARDYFIVNFRVNHTYSTPQTWNQIYSYNNPQGGQPGPTYPTFAQVAQLIAAVQPCGSGSDIVKGCNFLSVAPANSAIPIAVGANDSRFPVATGFATLTAGSVTVTTSSVLTGYHIQLTGQDDNVSGALRVSAISSGVSFTITSSNGADTGVVFWSIYRP